MKVFLLCILAVSSLWADCSYQADCYSLCPAARPRCAPTRLDPNPFDYPFHFWGTYVRTDKTEFKSGRLTNQRFRFSQYDLLFGRLEEITCITGIALELGYRWTHMAWDRSPFLRHKRFNEAGAFLRGFSYAIPGWYWRYGIGWWQQLAVMNMGRYGLFDGFLWGRYDLCPNLRIHVGILTQPGKRKGFTRPILGVDFRFRRNIVVNLIYPMDMSVLYHCGGWRFGVAGRPQRSRMRMRQNDPIPQGLIEYRSWGVELKGVYEPNDGIKVEAFVGSTIWSFVRVQTTLANPVVYSDLNAALYYGAYAFFVF